MPRQQVAYCPGDPRALQPGSLRALASSVKGPAGTETHPDPGTARLHTSPRSQPALALGGDTTPLHVKGASEGKEPDPTLHLPEVSG